MYGLIVKLTAAPNRRDDLITMLGGDDSHTIPGCLSFIVAEDTTDPDILWVTEVWESQAAHEASLAAPAADSKSEDRFKDAGNLILGHQKVATTAPVQQSSHPLHGEPQQPA